MRVAIGADHAGYALKEAIKSQLLANGAAVSDAGTDGESSVDYPDYAAAVARTVARGDADFGILVCATGVGMSIAANKVPGVRAALCAEPFTAQRCRAHNDANVICIGAAVVGAGMASEIVSAFLTTPFDGGRHARRVAKIAGIEDRLSAITAGN